MTTSACDSLVSVPIRGGSVIIDTQDLDIATAHHWHVIRGGQVQRTARVDGRRVGYYLAREILARMLGRPPEAGEQATTWSGDPTDLRRANVTTTLTKRRREADPPPADVLARPDAPLWRTTVAPDAPPASPLARGRPASVCAPRSQRKADPPSPPKTPSPPIHDDRSAAPAEAPAPVPLGRVRNPYAITATTRDAIIEAFIHRMPAIVHGMNLSAEGQTPDDFLSEAYVALVDIVDGWLGADGDNARDKGATLEQYVVRRVRLRLLDSRRAYGAKRLRLGTPLSQIVNADTGADFSDDGILPPSPDISGDAIMRLDVGRALRSLPDVQRRIVWMYDGMGYSMPDIAAATGDPTRRVRHLLDTARRRLAGMLQAYAPL